MTIEFSVDLIALAAGTLALIVWCMNISRRFFDSLEHILPMHFMCFIFAIAFMLASAAQLYFFGNPSLIPELNFALGVSAIVTFALALLACFLAPAVMLAEDVFYACFGVSVFPRGSLWRQ